MSSTRVLLPRTRNNSFAFDGFVNAAMRSSRCIAGLAIGISVLCGLIALSANRRDGPLPAALFGEYDGSGKMSKGLDVQAHDLGWDGGDDYQSSGTTYSNLPVSAIPSMSGSQSWFPDWNELTNTPSSSPIAQPAKSPIAQPAEEPENETGELQSAIHTGLKAAWDNLAGVVSMHGCDSACVKDIYRRAFRGHKTQARAADNAQSKRESSEQSAERRDNKLFGQTPSETDVSQEAFSRAYRDVSSIGVDAAPKVLGMLSEYLPQAVSAEKQLARALAQVQASITRDRRTKQNAVLSQSLYLEDQV